MTGLGVLRCIQDEWLQVPQDISLAGFEGLFVGSYIRPCLTTVRHAPGQLGQLAMESLLKLMSGQNSVDLISARSELIVQKSLLPLARYRDEVRK